MRVLDAEELAGHGVRGKELRNKLSHEQQKLFFHVTALSEALQSSDGVSLAAAYESLTSALIGVPEPHFHDQAIERGRRGFAKYMSRLALERGSGTAGCDLAQLVSTAISDARLVVWYSDQSDVLRPAFYCPNAACALFVNAVLHLQEFMAITGLCPCGCFKVFSRKGVPNKKYFNETHGAAYRMRKMREKDDKRALKALRRRAKSR